MQRDVRFRAGHHPSTKPFDPARFIPGKPAAYEAARWVGGSGALDLWEMLVSYFRILACSFTSTGSCQPCPRIRCLVIMSSRDRTPALGSPGSSSAGQHCAGSSVFAVALIWVGAPACKPSVAAPFLQGGQRCCVRLIFCSGSMVRWNLGRCGICKVWELWIRRMSFFEHVYVAPDICSTRGLFFPLTDQSVISRKLHWRVGLAPA